MVLVAWFLHGVLSAHSCQCSIAATSEPPEAMLQNLLEAELSYKGLFCKYALIERRVPTGIFGWSAG